MLTTVVWAVNIKVCCAFNNVSILVVVIWVVEHNKFSLNWGIICKLTIFDVIMLQNEFGHRRWIHFLSNWCYQEKIYYFLLKLLLYHKTSFSMAYSSVSQSWIDNNGNTWLILPTYLRWLQTIKRSSLKSNCSIYQACFGGFDFSSNNFIGFFVPMKMIIL